MQSLLSKDARPLTRGVPLIECQIGIDTLVGLNIDGHFCSAQDKGCYPMFVIVMSHTVMEESGKGHKNAFYCISDGECYVKDWQGHGTMPTAARGNFYKHKEHEGLLIKEAIEKFVSDE